AGHDVELFQHVSDHLVVASGSQDDERVGDLIGDDADLFLEDGLFSFFRRDQDSLRAPSTSSFTAQSTDATRSTGPASTAPPAATATATTTATATEPPACPTLGSCAGRTSAPA